MRSNMQIGSLNDVIEIMRRNLTIDENGFETETFEQVYRLRCKVNTQSSRSKLEESIKNDSETSRTVLKAFVRKRDFDADDYVKYKGEIHPIDNVHDYSDDLYEVTFIKRRKGGGL